MEVPPILFTKYGTAFINKNGYYYLPDGCGPDKPLNLHKKIFEDNIGRWVPSGWEIHHINGCRTDNRVENLVALERDSHRLLHEE